MAEGTDEMETGARYDGPIIDAHAHFFPDRMFEAIWAFFEAGGWGISHKARVEDMPGILAGHGIARYTTLNYARRPGQAADLNAWTADFVSSRPEAIPFCTLHAEDPDPWSTVAPCLLEKSFVGVKLQPLVSEFGLDDERLTEAFDNMAREGKVLLAHAGTAPYTNQWLGLGRFERMLERHPELTVVCAHMGAFEIDKALELLERFPNLYMDTAMIFVRTELFNSDPGISAEGVEALSGRLLFGSDYPNFPYAYEEAITSINRIGLSPAALRAIFHDNAVRVFGLSEAGD